MRHVVDVLAGDDRAKGHGVDGLKMQRVWKLLSDGVGKPWIGDAGIEEDNDHKRTADRSLPRRICEPGRTLATVNFD